MKYDGKRGSVEVLPEGTVERELAERGERLYQLKELPELMAELKNGQSTIVDSDAPVALLKAAVEARKEALDRVDEAADTEWKEQAYEAVVSTARRLLEFISDDVWESGLDTTREDRALGPVFLRAQRDGICTKTNRTKPSVRSHLSGKPIWVSHVYDGA